MDNDAVLLRAVTGAVLPLAAKLMRAVMDSGADQAQAWAAWGIVANHLEHGNGPAIRCDEANLRNAREETLVDALYR